MPFREAQAEYQTVIFFLFFLLRQRIGELAAEIRPPPPPAGRVNVLCEPLFVFSLGTICLY